MKKLFALVTGAVVAAFALAVAQPLIPTSWTGNEVIEVALGGPGGTGAMITLAQTRNATAGVVNNTTTGVVATTNLQNRVIFGTALTGTVTFNTPTNPYDGEMMEIVNGTNAAFAQTITFAPSGTQLLLPSASGALAALGAGVSGEFMYIQANNTWYRIR
jgi:hypothetical protein